MSEPWIFQTSDHDDETGRYFAFWAVYDSPAQKECFDYGFEDWRPGDQRADVDARARAKAEAVLAAATDWKLDR